MVNAFQQAFTINVDPDETPHYALFAMLSTFLVTVDNIKSSFTSLMVVEPKKGDLRADDAIIYKP